MWQIFSNFACMDHKKLSPSFLVVAGVSIGLIVTLFFFVTILFKSPDGDGSGFFQRFEKEQRGVLKSDEQLKDMKSEAQVVQEYKTSLIALKDSMSPPGEDVRKDVLMKLFGVRVPRYALEAHLNVVQTINEQEDISVEALISLIDELLVLDQSG